jgi:hypothetical protein
MVIPDAAQDSVLSPLAALLQNVAYAEDISPRIASADPKLCRAPTDTTTLDLGTPMMAANGLNFAVVYCHSPGLANDASVLAAAIKASNPLARFVAFTLPGRFTRDYTTPVEIKEEFRARRPFDFVFLLEHAHPNPPFLDPGFARHIVYVPNVEWITAADERVVASGSIDTVLLKTRYSGVVFSGLACSKRVKNGQLFTGWTSADVGEPAAAERSWEQCLHVCGKSPQKNADVVVTTWMQNPDLPPMTVVASARAGLDLSMPLRASANLTLLLQQQSESQLRALQRKVGIHVCPSFTEGFGHSLNEARSAAAVLITTAAPPMDELVEDGRSGVLVPVRPENQAPYHLVTASRVTSADLGESIRRALAMSGEQRTLMGRRARELYDSGRDQFQACMRRFIAG